MNRLVDYFIIVGFDQNCDRSVRSRGKILQRFPERDWADVPFNEGVALMVQPLGWRLKSYRCAPTFFASVLTGEDGHWHYFACLCFHEPVQLKSPQSVDDDEDGVDGTSSPGFCGRGFLDYCVESENRENGSPTLMYAPKCLVLVSRVDYFSTFKNCLGILYAVCLESKDIELETVVGNILCCVTVPPPGGPEIRFSIGAGDRQSLQPPLFSHVPVTHCWIAQLFSQLGIRNTIHLLCAALTEHKILFHSSSLNRLTEACHALVALMFPFRYNHVYIPVVPVSVLEVLETPTPFLIGIHSSLRSELNELNDVVVVDLDGGAMSMLDSVPLLPEPFLSETRDTLSRLLHPDLNSADLAFPNAGSTTAIIPPSFSSSSGSRTRLGNPCGEILDKEIRAVFMRIFARLLQGYRSCLTIIRIQPKPVIEFDKAAFLGQKNLFNCPFMTKLVERMFFTSFVQERGPPWRSTDIWDEVYSTLNDWQRLENQDAQMAYVHIKDLAEQLYNHEHPNPQPYVQNIPRLTEGAANRIYQPTFPTLNGAKIAEIIREGQKASPGRKNSRIPTGIPRSPRIVPMGPVVSSSSDSQPLVTNSARRLEVLRNCVRWIFENRTADARKICPAVLRALKSKSARLALCEELAAHVVSTKVELDHQQFDLVVHLMNCALWDAVPADENAVAAALLPLSISFCRKLSPRVYQFAFTCIQSHKIWEKLQFWETAYYQEVERQIKSLYKPFRPRPTSPLQRKYTHEGNVLSEPSALEIAADQMRQKVNRTPEELENLQHDEESTLYSQASQFMQWLVYMRVPLDSSAQRLVDVRNSSRVSHPSDPDFDGHSLANSVPESDSVAESGFEDSEIPEVTIRFVGRFIDKVCNEGGVSADHITALHENVRLVVAMHMEEMEMVNRESKRLPPIRKPEVVAPRFIPGEQLMFESLRAYLLPDGRDELGTLPGTIYVPAEGAIFLTNYRVIFKGAPCDPAACEQNVLRSIPLMTVTKEKKLGVQYLSNEESLLQEGVQIRSAVFQLLKLGFDTEVTVDKGEAFRKKLMQLRLPETPFSLFCFSDVQVPMSFHNQAAKDASKNATLRGIAKKTILKTAQKAGLTSKKPSKKKLAGNGVYGSPGHRSVRSVGGSSVSYVNSANESMENLDEDDDMSGVEDGEVKGRGTGGTFASAFPNFNSDQKTLDKLSDRRYVKDFKRFLELMDGFRLTSVNAHYKVTHSYPAAVVVPESMSDDSIRRLARLYRQARFPCFTWRHEVTGALLLRGAGFQSKNAVVGLFRNHHLHPGQQGSHGSQVNSGESSGVDQEKLLTAVVRATPLGATRPITAGNLSDSSMSINSLIATLGAADMKGNSTLTPEVGRKSNTPLQKAMTTFRDQTLFRSVSNSRNARMGFGAGNAGVGVGGPTENYPLAKGGSASSIGAHVMDKGLRFLGMTKRRGTRSSGGAGSKGPGGVGAHSHRLSTASNSDGESTAMDDISIGSSGVHSFRRSALYVFGDKSQIKGLRGDLSGKCDFVPVDYPDARHTKTSFKNILSACVPSKRPNDGDSFLRDFEKSEWLNHLQKIMQLSGAVVDLIDLQGSSVMLCFEDGSDITPQVMQEKDQENCTRLSRHLGSGAVGELDLERNLFASLDCPREEDVAERAATYLADDLVPPASDADGLVVGERSVGDGLAAVLRLLLARRVRVCGQHHAAHDWLWPSSTHSGAAWRRARRQRRHIHPSDCHGFSTIIPLQDKNYRVSSIAQLCLDPYYRTMDGFRVLVEKEWLAFGHKFSYRTGHTAASQNTALAPFFLQFLDIVHQILIQYPMAFEFNQYYLKFLAYHSMSHRFKTFVFNWELDRVGLSSPSGSGTGDMSWSNTGGSSHRPKLVDFITSHSDEELGFLTFRNNANGSHTSSPTGGPHAWDSVFDYIEEHSVRSPTFFNFMFSRDSMTTVLRPFSGIPSLEIWDFFLSEDLSKGSCYDFEAAEIDDPFSKKRRTVLAGYDCVDACSLSGFLQVLENLRTAQVKLGRLAQMWRNVWDKLEPPSNATLTKADMVSAVQLQGRLLHKRATVDILLRGRLTNEISPGVGASVSGDSGHQVSFSHPHRFERCSYATPTYCDYCSRLLWGIVRQTGMKCMDCGYNAHERCVDTAPKNCQKVSPGTISVEVLPPEPETETIAPDEPSTVGISPGRHAASCPPESHGSVAEQEDGDDVRLSQSAAQSISVAYLQDLKALQPRGQDRAAGYYDGYLYKRGAKLKAWPKRWFVLDPMKHQLRYYHSKEDNHWKGLIDLDKVQSAVAVPPPSGLRGIPKGFDDNSFFDVVVTLQEGTRRVYNFCAFNGNAATTWIEKIQACL